LQAKSSGAIAIVSAKVALDLAFRSVDMLEIPPLLRNDDWRWAQMAVHW
jgi:hypothetical protein